MCVLSSLHAPEIFASWNPKALLNVYGWQLGGACRRRRAWCPKMTCRGPGQACAHGSPAFRGNFGSAVQPCSSRPTARTCSRQISFLHQNIVTLTLGMRPAVLHLSRYAKLQKICLHN